MPDPGPVGTRSDSSKAVVMLNPLLAAAAAPIATDPDDLSGAVLAERYRLIRILGQGGMGNVFLAEHVTTGKPLAVKVLALRWSAQPEYRDRFLREARAATRIGHEHVVEVHDFGETPNGSVFMAMELLQGEELAALVAREAPLPWPRTKSIALQVCRALYAAHEKGVLHRDIKPENCWRMRRGANRDFIKVIDFGIAKIVGDERDPNSSLTRAGTIFGTPEYMSPEQARGRPVDARSDVYATGVLIYELVTGQVPFTGETFMDVLTQQVSAEPPPPRTVAPQADIPIELEEVIAKALRKAPEDRYPSMRELAEAVAAIPTHRHRETVPARQPDTARTDRARMVPVAVVWVLVAVIGALSLALIVSILGR
jgi:serine/threonine protein kinase